MEHHSRRLVVPASEREDRPRERQAPPWRPRCIRPRRDHQRGTRAPLARGLSRISEERHRRQQMAFPHTRRRRGGEHPLYRGVPICLHVRAPAADHRGPRGLRSDLGRNVLAGGLRERRRPRPRREEKLGNRRATGRPDARNVQRPDSPATGDSHRPPRAPRRGHALRVARRTLTVPRLPARTGTPGRRVDPTRSHLQSEEPASEPEPRALPHAPGQVSRGGGASARVGSPLA